LEPTELKTGSRHYAKAGVVSKRDAPLLESPVGREDDHGRADCGHLANDEVEKPVGGRPRSWVTGKHDDGAGANETSDGLDERSEDARRSAEETPTGTGREDREPELPVFERGLSAPKV
jgi:hypothetical protein